MKSEPKKADKINTKVVVKSRFFRKNKTEASDKQEEKVLEEPKAKTVIKTPMKKSSGSWLDELEDTTPTKNEFVYRTANMTSPDADEKENGSTTKEILETTPELVRSSRAAFKKAFKPVVLNPEKYEEEEETKAKARNPFAVKSTLKTPVKDLSSPSPIKSSCSPRKPLPLSRPIVRPLELDPDQVAVAPSLDNIDMKSPEREAKPDTATTIKTVGGKSEYFSAGASSKKASGCTRGKIPVSGLLKSNKNNKPSGGRQVNLFDLWGKKNASQKS